MKRWVLLGWTLATILTASAVFAETCLSPYVKGLRQPEKVMYLWTLPANGPGPDYLSVVDVNLASPTYGKIVKKVEVGSTGNEAHHIGFTDDRTKIWAASLNTSRLFIFDVGADGRMKLDPFFAIDFSRAPDGPARPHDMLLN